MSTTEANNSIRLLSDLADDDGAALTFSRVLANLAAARELIEIHMFVWRNDEIGNQVGRAVLEAAERGVQVRIKKDTDAFMYERIEMNRKPFFNVPISFGKRILYGIRSVTFPNTYVADDRDDALSRRLMNHPHVTMEWVDHTHTKYYIFDRHVMLTGSINVEDRHRRYRDYMVEIIGGDLIERFEDRNAGRVELDLDRSIEFVVNRVSAGRKQFEIKPVMIDLIDATRHSLYVEMAYIGDPDITAAIIAASQRGVRVTMLFSRTANIGNDINYRALHAIYRRCDIAVYLTDKMIHSKLMLFDEQRVILGSANISVFSMQKAVELDLVVQQVPDFLDALLRTRDRRVSESVRVDSVSQINRYNRVIASLQQLHQLLH